MNNVLRITLTAALTLALGLAVHGQLQVAGQLAAVERQLDYVQMRLDDRPQPAPVLRTASRDAAVQPATLAPQQTPAVAVTPGVDATVRAADPNEPLEQSPPAVYPAVERGYIYAQDWEDMESALSAMTTDQQKQHWDHVFQAIESGTLEVYDE